jgi:hypothetical protein
MMGRRLRESMVRRRRKKVDDVLTTLKRHCKSDCVLEEGGFRQNLQRRDWSVYLVWKVRILICGGIERVGSFCCKRAAESSDLQGHMRVYFITSWTRIWHVKYRVGHRGKSCSRLAPGTLFAKDPEHAEASIARILLSFLGLWPRDLQGWNC